MADSKRESREVDFVSCNDMDYCCSGKCAKGKDVLPKEHEKESSEITVTVTADVGDAITGFKALQRELRETTKAARELEQAYKDVEEAFEMTKPVAEKCGVTDEELLVTLLDGKAISKAVEPTVERLREQELIDAVRSEGEIPDKLREAILHKFSEDGAKLIELERYAHRR